MSPCAAYRCFGGGGGAITVAMHENTSLTHAVSVAVLNAVVAVFCLFVWVSE